jgi:hypothetical protein
VIFHFKRLHRRLGCIGLFVVARVFDHGICGGFIAWGGPWCVD